MNPLKKLASETIWYGMSSIGVRFLNYLLTPLLTYLMYDASGVRDYGDYSLVYVWIALANIIFTYGLETGYFRFINRKDINPHKLYNTSLSSLLVSSVILFFTLFLFREKINIFLGLQGPATYIVWCGWIIALDAINTIPFARLRQEGRPKKYAFIKILGVFTNILGVVIFMVYLPKWAAHENPSRLIQWLNDQNTVGLLILSNVIQNFLVTILLWKEWKVFRFQFDFNLWKAIMKYSSPMIIIGLAGMVNEVMDRQLLSSYLPLDEDDAKRLVGIYSANYKLAIFITLFIQAFRMAAEPFFFKQAADKNAPKIYAEVMKWFVITMCFAFLFTILFIDIWKYLIGASYRSGLVIVPILLLANIFLGIYYNLSIWYKITDKMTMGIYITLLGMVVTLVGNIVFIPYYGMFAAAYTTLACYGLMMVLAYFLGQRYFPVPYSVKKILALISTTLLFFGVHRLLTFWTETNWWSILVGLCLFLLFFKFILTIEKRHLKQIPLMNRFYKK